MPSYDIVAKNAPNQNYRDDFNARLEELEARSEEQKIEAKNEGRTSE